MKTAAIPLCGAAENGSITGIDLAFVVTNSKNSLAVNPLRLAPFKLVSTSNHLSPGEPVIKLTKWPFGNAAIRLDKELTAGMLGSLRRFNVLLVTLTL